MLAVGCHMCTPRGARDANEKGSESSEFLHERKDYPAVPKKPDSPSFLAGTKPLCKVGRTDQWRPRVERDVDLQPLHEIAEAALVGKSAHEGPTLEDRQHLGRDAAADIDAADRYALQSQVAGLGTIEIGKHLVRLDTHGVLAGQTDLGDDGTVVSGPQFFGEPTWLGG